MFDNVLVGVDDGGGSDAVALAKRLVAEHGQLTLAHIFRGDDETWRGARPPADQREERRIYAMLEGTAKRAGVDAELRWHGASAPGRGLHELAEGLHADLLVVGSSRRGLFGRVLLGDDTRRALNGAPCAVAIAPAGYADEPGLIREIGVAYNGSPESEHALGVARALAEQHDSKLSAFEAVTVPRVALGSGVGIKDVMREVVDDHRSRLSALEGVEPHAAFGYPAEELSLYSASLGLLLVGSRSYGPMGRLLHGSTAQKLTRTARCPLLVITRAAREGETSASSAAGHAAMS
jgi:nucleotide-binding universal stress UspA family protein